ncbi:mycocerosic acid synthase-like polyketide synthase [Antedon mediterranea]|uniref:mycocerosic acid synthase-like polyketide synthase n=1 Tax=Antedon mediterranea TaxID=105859 RepID=UPI003AF86691
MSIRNLYRSIKPQVTVDDSLDDENKIAIVGIGCRYGDGVAGPRQMWEMLMEERDCTGPPPPQRFDKSTYFFPGEKQKGKLYTKAGGYLEQNPMMFDRQFFKMSPEEAEHMDPQIRILLEVVWESIEDAGISASSLRGSNTGVYMGVTANEYLHLTGFPQSNIGQYTNSGTNSCMISNRISYEFDLRGPSFSIDTACSSSLYAVKVACDALKGGVCDTAIAGGVNIILTPLVTIGFCQAGMLSPDGQCRSFDESANGYSRSEGVGSVILKPLKRAVEDGDRIYAVIRGGALTNDGRTPGIANPSFDAQIDLVYRACTAAKVDPCDIAYIEAHGTGTKVGDKTEANAIGEAMSKKRSDDMPPLYIGSIKSNVGHAEGAAGIAGVIKTALSLYHREIPGVVHFKRGNPNINFKDLKLKVPPTSIPWPTGSKFLAGCSSFGFGGANAHVVFEAAPLKPFNSLPNRIDNMNGNDGEYHTLLLSASSKEALDERCSNWVDFLVEDLEMRSDAFINALYTANVRSHRHSDRLALLAKSRNELVKLLRDRVKGNSNSNMTFEGKAPEGNTFIRIVFVFSGMGTQWWGMARQLMNTQLIFNSVIKKIDVILGKYGATWSLVQMLSEENDKDRINNTEISQTCICSVQIGLVELYKHYGVTPSAIIGHSVGEVAAAYAAGLISMSTAVRIIFTRGHLLVKTSGSGTMAAILHDVDDIQDQLKSTDLDVAALNSPSQIVVSGTTLSINKLTSKLKQDGIQARELKVNNAFHSRQQEILKKEFFKETRFLKKRKSSSSNCHRPLFPMMSTVTNRYLTLQEANSSEYWWNNIRHKVRFKDAVDAVLKDGYNSFLEIGAHPALAPAIKDTIASTPNKPTIQFITHSLKRPRDVSNSANDILSFNMSIAQLFVSGYKVDLSPYFQGFKVEVESLPLYPWQRITCSAATEAADINMRYPHHCHPLLGESESSANYHENKKLRVWKSNIGTHKEPWIADHILQGSVVLPAAGFIETAIAAHRELFTDSRPVVMSDLRFDRFLFVSEADTILETTTEMELNGQATFALRSFNTKENKWMTHSTMHLKQTKNNSEEKQSFLPIFEIKGRCLGELDKSGFYDIMTKHGFSLGNSFMCIEKVKYSRMVDEALLYIHAPDTVVAQSSRFNTHPAIIDGILQAVGGLVGLQGKVLNPTEKPIVRAPRGVKNVNLSHVTFPTNVVLHYKLSDAYSDTHDLKINISIADAESYAVLGKFEQISFGSVAATNEQQNLRLWEKQWIQVYPGESSYNEKSQNILMGDDSDLTKHLSKLLKQEGISAMTIAKGSDFNSDTDEQKNIILLFKAGDKDLTTISKTDLLNQQAHIATSCLDQYNKYSRKKEQRPNMWLVTRDAFPANHDDVVDPTQSSAYGFALCVMQEDPTMKVFIVDLPSNLDNQAASKWLTDYIWKTDPCDNIVALRKSKLDRPYDAFSLRLAISKPDEFPLKVASSIWKFDIGKSLQNGKVFLTKDIRDHVINCTDNVDIHVAAFHLMTTKENNTSDEDKSVVFFCGQSDKNTSFIGFCEEEELRSTIRCHQDDVVEVTSSLNADEIVNIVSRYIIPFGVIRNFRSCKESTTIVCLSSNKDKIGLSMAHIAAELKHNVIVAVKDLSINNGVHLHDEYRATVLDIKDVMYSLNSQSVGIVVGCESVVTELFQLCNMKEKLKPFSIISIIDTESSTDTNSKLRGLPKHAVVEKVSYAFSSKLELQKMRPVLDELVGLFEKPSSMINQLKEDVIPKVIPLENIAVMNDVSFSNVTVAVGNSPVSTSYDFLKGEIVFKNEESYLVTGGTKGFGLCLVEWLSAKGAGCVYILSRSEPDAEERERLDYLNKSGTAIVHIKTDITSSSDVELAFKRISSDMSYQLSGIFHCAAQYDDRLLNDITPEVWKKVMAAKSWGALLLHQMSVKFNTDLKYFVMISSIVQLIGNSGQASYCAANTFLSSLGFFRRSKCLPATVFCPGVIKSDGYAARAGLVDFWDRRGVEGLPPMHLLNGLGILLRSGVKEMGLSGNFRERDFIRENKIFAKEHITIPSGRFSILKEFDIENIKLQVGDSGQNDITQYSPEVAKSFVLNKLCGFISERLGITGDISPDVSPSSIGVDSLMTTEFSGFIQSTFNVFVPPMELMNANITLLAISASIYKNVLAEKQIVDDGNNDEEEDDTSWKAWYVIDERVTPDIQLICFPPNGGGPSTYAWWQNNFDKYNVQVIMAKLPGWEGRQHEKPLQTIEEMISHLTENLAPRLISGKFVLFGHSLGGLLAFEVAHRLMERNIRPAHLVISSWYAPTLNYPNATELENAPKLLRQMEQDIKNNIRVVDKQSLKLSFVDDDVLGNNELMRRLIPCFHVGFRICQMYSNTHKEKLQCGMTIIGAKSDRFIPISSLDAWCLEIESNQPFKKIIVPGGHMHITSAKKKFFNEMQSVLKDAFDF